MSDFTCQGEIKGVVRPRRSIIAFDQSLTKTGVACLTAARSGIRVHTTLITPPANLNGLPRLEWWWFTFDNVIKASAARVTVMEGYSMSSKFQTHQSGELGAVLKLVVSRSPGDSVQAFSQITPGCHKKLTTGNGGAKKSQTMLELHRRFGLYIPQEDVADAVSLALCAWAADLPDPSETGLPKGHLEALKKVHLLSRETGFTVDKRS